MEEGRDEAGELAGVLENSPGPKRTRRNHEALSAKSLPSTDTKCPLTLRFTIRWSLSLSLPRDMSRALYRLKGAKSAFRPPHESSTLREPGTKGCRTYPAVVILPQAATTTPSPDLPSRPRELPTALAGAPQSLHSLPQEHSQRIAMAPSWLAPA